VGSKTRKVNGRKGVRPAELQQSLPANQGANSTTRTGNIGSINSMTPYREYQEYKLHDTYREYWEYKLHDPVQGISGI